MLMQFRIIKHRICSLLGQICLMCQITLKITNKLALFEMTWELKEYCKYYNCYHSSMSQQNEKQWNNGKQLQQETNQSPDPIKQSPQFLELKSQLKEQSKELKGLQAKNSKLESKFIEIFKENKLLKKDHQSFVGLLRQIFPDLQEQALGNYEFEELSAKWVQKEQSVSRKINQMIEEAAYEKQQLSKRIKEEMSQAMQSKDLESKSFLANLKNELEEYKKSHKALTDQMVGLDRKLDSRNDEISKLTKEKLKLEHQVNQLKLKDITAELGSTQKNPNDKQNQDLNEFLALRQQVDSLMEKRDELRNQLKEAKQVIADLKHKIDNKQQHNQFLVLEINEIKAQLKSQSELEHNQSSVQQHSSPSVPQPKSSSVLDDSHDKQSGSNPCISGGSQQGFHHLSLDDDYVHREYVKNLFLRYMKCCNMRDQVQAEILLNIILTLLKFNSDERQQLHSKKSTWWSVY